MTYINPFGPPSSGFKDEEKSFQSEVTKDSKVRRNSSATPSPHGEKMKFAFFTRRFSLPDTSKSLVKADKSSDRGEVSVVWKNSMISSDFTPTSFDQDRDSDSVAEFRVLWVLPSSRMKIKEIIIRRYAIENYNFLMCLEGYYKLFDVKNKIKKIIAEHNRIIQKYLSENAPSKIHIELPPIKFEPIIDQPFTLIQLKEKFKVVEHETFKTIALNIMNDPVYILLKDTYLETASQRTSSQSIPLLN